MTISDVFNIYCQKEAHLEHGKAQYTLEQV